MNEIIINEFRRRVFEESFERIKHCLSLLDEKEIWYDANSHVNSVGKLILHINGNARQWILCGLMGQTDTRQRELEFNPEIEKNKAELIELLNETKILINKELDKIKEEQLISEHSVQGVTENGFSILIHVIEHCSYHTGQITYITKMLKNCDTGYYKNQDLNITGK